MTKYVRQMGIEARLPFVTSHEHQHHDRAGSCDNAGPISVLFHDQ
jgi:hypothetical protein